MLFYITWFTLVMILLLLSDSISSGVYKRALRSLAILIVMILSAFRYDVGQDYLSYRNSIINLDSNFYNSELINKGLFYAAHLLSLPQLYFIITTGIIFLIIDTTIKRYSNYYTLSFLIFLSFPLFFANSLTIIRQFVAMSIVFYSVKYIIEKRSFFKFSILILLAIGFHTSAIVAFPIFFLSKIKIKSWVYLVMFGFPIILKEILVYIIANYAPSYNKYITYKYGLDAGGGKAIYLFMLVCAFLLLFQKRINRISENNRFYLNSTLFGTIIYWALLDFGHIGMRIGSFYLMFCIVLLPNSIRIFVSDNRKYMVYLLYMLCFLVFLTTFGVGIKNGESSYIPYKFIFQK